jgi:TrmH family RNA methyltransferase
MPKQITSLQNPLIRNILLLEEKPRERRQQNLAVIEGIREVRLALASGFTVPLILWCKEFLETPELDALLKGTGNSSELAEITPDIFNKLAYRKDTGGIIATVVPKRLLFHDLRFGPQPLFLVLETVEKPGNLGAILRTADAANLDGVIICDPQTDIYNPNAIRSSLGCIFTMPIVTTTTEHAIHWFREQGIRTFGTALTATRHYHETDYRTPAAIIMGSEAFGLSGKWLDEADELVKIPLRGKVDSMNVSASAAVVVFEALRQRGFQNFEISVS